MTVPTLHILERRDKHVLRTIKQVIAKQPGFSVEP